MYINSKQHDTAIKIKDRKLYDDLYFKLTTKIIPSIVIQRPRLEVDLQS
jgi:hypothetical protein